MKSSVMEGKLVSSLEATERMNLDALVAQNINKAVENVADPAYRISWQCHIQYGTTMVDDTVPDASACPGSPTRYCQGCRTIVLSQLTADDTVADVVKVDIANPVVSRIIIPWYNRLYPLVNIVQQPYNMSPQQLDYMLRFIQTVAGSKDDVSNLPPPA